MLERKDCPKCGKKDAFQVFSRNSYSQDSVGICQACGFRKRIKDKSEEVKEVIA